jgi:hypothetical protein
VVGRQLRKDQHTKQMMPGIGNNRNAAVEISAIFLQCMSLFMALSAVSKMSGIGEDRTYGQLSQARALPSSASFKPQLMNGDEGR